VKATRFVLLAIAAVSMSATSAYAQRVRQHTDPAPSIGLPLPAIGLPLPPIGLPPAETASPSRPQRPDGQPPVLTPAPIVFFGAPYAFGYEDWQQSPVPGVIPEPPDGPERRRDSSGLREQQRDETGRLILDLTPRDSQVFVNGEFVGTWNDFAGELELPAGRHGIDVRAPGYETLSFDVRIVAGRSIRYRDALNRVAERSGARGPDAGISRPPTTPPATTPTARKTFYLIPGCYLGNVPPEELKLPDGCDLSRMITHTPGAR
jgi:hypothetical protein